MCSAIEYESFKARADLFRRRLRDRNSRSVDTGGPVEWVSDEEIAAVVEADRREPAAR
jgi:hypothetical protein